MENLIEIHVIQNFAPSNLNRDDTGAPKDALFGGTRRARVSSQSFKHAIRQYFNTMVQQGELEDKDVGLRTKRVLDLLTQALVKMGRSEAESKEKAILALESIKLKILEDKKSQYLLFLGKQEIEEVSRIINEKWDIIKVANNQVSTEKKNTKSKTEAAQQFDPELKKSLEKIFNGGKAIDVALFGRMLTDMPEKNQYASCQVAHSISTHSVEREFDFYIAIDNLKPDDNPGADMMGTVEFNSACFYRYSNIDLNKLIENLGSDEELAIKGLKAFIEAFLVAIPTGKQNSFAAHNPPEFIAITIRKNAAPRNLANAFETAVYVKSGESITGRSAQKLVDKAMILQKAFEGDSETFVLNLAEVNTKGFGTEVNSLKELLDKTIASLGR